MGLTRTIALLATATALVVGGYAQPAAAAAEVSAAANTGRAGDCSLTGRTLHASATVNQQLTERFAIYGDSGQGWTGGDSTYSLPVRGGTGWFFSDTFLGEVADDGSRPSYAPFVNNSIVIDGRRGLSTVTGGTALAPDALIPTGTSDSWYWIGDPTTGRGGTVQVPLLQFAKTGTGQWDFAWTANRLAILDGTTLQLRSIVDLPSATGINWGSWTLEQGRDTYVFGVADPDGIRSAYVARARGGDGIAGRWTFWTGKGWSDREEDAVPVVANVANEFSVAPFRDGYLLITQDTSELFSSRIVARMSCSPTGPFTEPVEIYRTPETGAAGTYADADVFTYNAHEHPDLRRGNRILVTYNVNSFDNVGDVYEDVTIYRPRFVDVQLSLGR